MAGRVRLGTIIGAKAFDDRAVATLLFRRRRIGARIRLSASLDRATRSATRSAAAALPSSRSRHASGSRRSAAISGSCPFLDGGTLTTRHRPRTSASGSSARASASAIIRASARSVSMSERRSIRARAMRRSRSSFRSGRPSEVAEIATGDSDGAAALSAEAGLARGGSAVELRHFGRRACWRLPWSALLVLDTAPGHRFIVDRIAQIETASGLRFRIGRIEGSIFGETRLKNVAVLDRRGVFLTSPEIDVDWTPGAWLRNALLFRHGSRPSALTLLRLPKLKPTGRKGPILPKFDIHIGELSIQRLELGAAGHGRRPKRDGPRQGRHPRGAGRSIDLRAAMDRGGDRLAILLDAEPDGNRFDLEARVALSRERRRARASLGTKRSIGSAHHRRRKLERVARHRRAQHVRAADRPAAADRPRRTLRLVGSAGARASSSRAG